MATKSTTVGIGAIPIKRTAPIPLPANLSGLRDVIKNQQVEMLCKELRNKGKSRW